MSAWCTHAFRGPEVLYFDHVTDYRLDLQQLYQPGVTVSRDNTCPRSSFWLRPRRTRASLRCARLILAACGACRPLPSFEGASCILGVGTEVLQISGFGYSWRYSNQNPFITDTCQRAGQPGKGMRGEVYWCLAFCLPRAQAPSLTAKSKVRTTFEKHVAIL